MRLSIVLTTLNGADTIGEQLDALATQDWEGSLEVIVSDNGSTDETRAVIESFSDRFHELSIVDSSDLHSCAHARNVGAAAATGDYLLFCDDDDKVGAGWLKAMVVAFERHPFIAARLDHDLLNPSWTRAVYGEPQRHELPGPPSFLPFAFGGSIGVSKAIHTEMGGFDETYSGAGEDVDYCYRIQLSGTPLHFVPDALIHYRDRQGYGEIFRQNRAFGRAWTTILKEYTRHGMARPSQLRAVGSWFPLALRLPISFGTRNRRALWISQAGWKLGRLEGSVHERTLGL